MKIFSQISDIARRECNIIFTKNPIYLVCMVIFPIMIVSFFTTLLDDGQPLELPVGVVDMDNTSTSRGLIRTLDGFQTSDVVAHYNNMNEARNAVQRGEIYAFLLIPEGTTEMLMASKQPKISFYYNGAIMLAGSTTFRDLKAVSLLGSAAVGAKKLAAIGKTGREIKAFLQPISVDLHMINNPWASYNIYLTSVMVPGLFFLIIFLVTTYSIGTELKFKTGKEWMEIAGDNPFVAVTGKMLPQTVIFLIMFYLFEFYIYGILDFPHSGGVVPIMLSGLVTVLSSQGFGIFVFGLVPSLRLSMTICCLLAMLGISMAGSTFPVFAMDGALQSLSWIFPLRHYYMIYQINIFNGYPMSYAALHWTVLCAFILIPVFVMWNIRKAMHTYKYIA